MIRVAVIGLGHPHIFSMMKQLQAESEFEIVALCDPNEPANIERAQQMVPQAKCYEDENLLYGDLDFDVVLSSAANGKKGGIALRALRANKSIVFDKPLVSRQQELEEIKSLLSKNPELTVNLWLTCRYAKGYYTVKKMIDEGVIGEPVHLYFVRPMRLAPQNRPEWMFDQEQYGGILNDIGVHDIDLARWFTGSECKSVLSASTASVKFSKHHIEDAGSVYMQMETGAIAVIFESWLTPDQFPAHSDARVMVTGTKGMIEMVQYPEITVKLVSDDLEPQVVPLQEPQENQAQELLHVLQKIKKQTLLSPYDAIKTTELALAIQSLARKGKKNEEN